MLHLVFKNENPNVLEFLAALLASRNLNDPLRDARMAASLLHLSLHGSPSGINPSSTSTIDIALHSEVRKNSLRC
jgi:hypothetical protein